MMGGVEVFGFLKEIGSLEVGKKVDMVLLDLDDFYMYFLYEIDVYFCVVYFVIWSCVDMVIIDGSIVFKNCKIQIIDCGIVFCELDKSIVCLMKRI